jgi:tRNA(Ile)-lysidine synthase
MRIDKAVSEVRRTVRSNLEQALEQGELAAGDLVLAAVSGGADSLALAAALAWTGPRLGLRAGAVTVDHGLQQGSAKRAVRVVKQCRGLGLEPAVATVVKVGRAGGPEAAARAARYTGFADVAAGEGASAIALGHTLDDQAETVLLGLARGSGARSLAAMRGREVIRCGLLVLRPLLAVRRRTTARACTALGLATWNDPHNADRKYARVRLRRDALPALEKAIGPGIAQALARTADLLRADADALDAWAAGASSLAIDDLAVLPAAIRRRVLRAAAVAAGATDGELAAVHVAEVDRLVMDWHGQGAVSLPGGLVAERQCDRLHFR